MPNGNSSINNKASEKSKNEQKNEEKVRGYVPKNCDLKCYKCPYQGFCILPRRFIEARRHYVLEIENKKPFLNRKYGLNNFNSIFSLYNRIFRPILRILSRLNKNFRGVQLCCAYNRMEVRVSLKECIDFAAIDLSDLIERSNSARKNKK